MDGIDQGCKHAELEWHAKATPTHTGAGHSRTGDLQPSLQEKRRESRARKRTCWGRKEPLVGGGERVAAVEGLQDPGDAAHLAVEVRAPVLRQRPQTQVLGRHPAAPLPLPLSWKEEAQGTQSGNAGGCPPLQQLRKKMSSVAAPPHFPEEFGGPHRRGNAPGRERRSCWCLPDGEHQPRRPATGPLLPLALSHCPAPALQLAGWQDFQCPPLLPRLVPMAYGCGRDSGGKWKRRQSREL